MKRLVTTLLLATVALSIAEPATDGEAAGGQQAEPLQTSELLRALGGTYFRIQMPAEISSDVTACLMHRLKGGAVTKLASLSEIRPNQILTLVFIKTGQKKPYFSMSHATSTVCNEIDVDTPLVVYSPSKNMYSPGNGLVTFNYDEGIDDGGIVKISTSSLFVQLQNDKGEQVGAAQPATSPESKSEGGDKHEPKSEGRTR